MTIAYSGQPLSFCFDDVDPMPLYDRARENRTVPDAPTGRDITVPELMDIVFEALHEMRPARDLINAALGRWHDANFPGPPPGVNPEKGYR